MELFGNLTADLPIVVKQISEQKGKGVFAKRKISEGEVVIKEVPIVACQYSHNKVSPSLVVVVVFLVSRGTPSLPFSSFSLSVQDYFPSCSHCLKSLETPAEMLRRLAGHEAVAVLPMAETCVPSVEIFVCETCQGEKYCSVECRDLAWRQYHRILCSTADNKDNGQSSSSSSSKKKNVSQKKKAATDSKEQDSPLATLEEAWK